MKIFWAIASCLSLVTSVCHGQEFLFVRYTPKDGLINGRARFIVQDSRGRLYISTFGGLSIYDGSRFINYSTENGLSTSLVNDIVELGPDSLLIVPNTRALHIMVRGAIRDIRTVDQFYPVTNRLIRTAKGELYALADDGLFRYRDQRFEKLRMIAPDGMDAGPLLLDGVEAGGRLFMLTDPFSQSYPGAASLLVFDPGTGKLLMASKPDRFMAVARTAAGQVFVATDKGVRMLNIADGTLRLIPPPPPYAAAARVVAGSLFFGRGGSLWMTAGKEIVEIDRSGNFTGIGPTEGLPAGIVNSVFEDRERNIWLTNNQNGIERLVSRRVTLYDSAAPGFAVMDVSAEHAGDSVWFLDATHRKLLLETSRNRSFFQTRDPLPPTGHILFGMRRWLTAPGGVYQIGLVPGRERFHAIPVFRDSLLMDGRIFIDRKGRLVISSTGITVIGEGRVWRRNCPELCDQASVDREGRIWATSRSDSLMVLEPDETPGSSALRLIAAWHPSAARSPRSLCIDSNDRVWIGTRDHGLFCLVFDGLKLRSVRRLTIENGLSEDFIRYLYCDPDNTIWAGTPSGLDMIRWNGDSLSVTNITPGRQVGVLKIGLSAGGVHIALLENGFMRIAPDRRSGSETQPAVLFSRIFVGNTPLTTGPGELVSLSYDRSAISFDVGAPSFTDEAQTRYCYLLEGSSDAAWSAPSRRSAINFLGLPPGKYRLWVKAKFLSGMYPDALGSYPFVIRPAWWQTTLFRITALAVLLILIGWGIRSYTRNRLKVQRIELERQRAIEKERTRIATDMHDDLGAGLSRIKFLSDTIGIKQQRQMPIDEEIDGIREYSKEMIDKMGEIVWALNQKHDLLSDLLSYTRSYAAAYLMQAAIDARIDAPEEFPYVVVSGEFRRNVYLAVKEALHNVVRHSQARQVIMQMAVGRELVIMLQDDGVGFVRSAIRPFANGLVNIERRIAELGGRLEIETRPNTADASPPDRGDGERRNPAGFGTRVTIVVPV